MADPSVALDPYAMPMPVIVGLYALTIGLFLYWRLTSRVSFTPRNEQIYHGLFMIILGLLGGLLIPHVVRPRSMLTFHALGNIQGATLIAFAAAWSIFYPNGGGSLAAWLNIIGFYLNMIGLLYSAFTGTQSLLYMTKQSTPALHAVGSVAETILEVTLKLEGVMNVVGPFLMAYSFLRSQETDGKKKA